MSNYTKAKQVATSGKFTTNLFLGKDDMTIFCCNPQITNLRTDEIVFFVIWRKLVLTKIKQFTVYQF